MMEIVPVMELVSVKLDSMEISVQVNRIILFYLFLNYLKINKSSV
jgi:hypothetical protein